MKHLRLLAALPLAVTLTACGTSEPAADDTAETPAASGPVSVVDSRGETVELEAPATKVVALEWMQAESLITLGVMPVGLADKEYYNTWVASAPVDDSVAAVGSRGEPSTTSVLKLAPDLVIADATTSANAIKALEKQVPVLVVRSADAKDQLQTMRDGFTMIAEAVGKETEAEEVLADLDAKLAEGKEAIEASDSAGTSFAFADGWVDGGNVAVRMFGEGSLMSDLAESLGLENAWTQPVDGEWGLGTTDPEGLTTLEGDVSFFYNQPEEGSDVFVDDLEKNPIWTTLPFVEAGRVYKLDTGVWTFGGPRSAEKFVDSVVASLT
ncbi:MAG TPA: iron-siderophore ABC transporter substrate-binding protein [Nocardioidaceae bacterium]|nr:iron-siderophore ABC transporter substrate-binding protein [Nocardioidaceae bacterium]